MNNNEIVSDILSLIHTNTQLNYIQCSEISSKIFAYFEKIQYKDNQWTQLNQTIQTFNQSSDHPDVKLFQQLLQTISQCSHDDEERNYTLGRDKYLLIESISRLRDLLKSHVNLHCYLLRKFIEQQDIRLQLIDLMNLTGMNMDDDIHGHLFEIVHFLCELDPTLAASTVIDHSIVLNCIRIIENKSQTAIRSAVILLTDLMQSNGTFPIQTNEQLSNDEFFKSLFELIENDDFVNCLLTFFLAFNLRYDYPNENPLILGLIDINEQISTRKLIENLILLFNRNIDSSLIKFFADLFGDYGDLFFSLSNRQLIVEILVRELSNHSSSEQITTSYLSLLELILRTRMITFETCTRISDMQICLETYRLADECLDENRFIINEILRANTWLKIANNEQ